MKTLGLRRKSPVQTILILLVESGLVYFGFQVCANFDMLFNADMCVHDPQLKIPAVLTDSVLVFPEVWGCLP